MFAEARSPELPEEEDPIIQVSGLNHFFGEGDVEKQVLFENELTLMPGELVIMTGPSGSGKTTLLTLIGALRKVQHGSLRVLGKELASMRKDELVAHRRGVGFIFQAHNLFPALTAVQNVHLALALSDIPRREWDRLATEMLTRLGLGHRLHHKPHQLSGGQRQRVAIARALVRRPKIVLADEPTAALDKASSRDVVELFKELVREERCTVLMVTHDSRILDVADRIVNMIDGRIASQVMVQDALRTAEFLHGLPLFEKQTTTELSALARKMRRERFPSGAEIVRQGEEGDRFYLISRGKVVVEVEAPSGKKTVAELGPGGFFGETALLQKQPRNATVRAVEPVEVHSLGREDFHAALAAVGGFEAQLMNAVVGRA